MGAQVSALVAHHASWWASHAYPAYATMQALKRDDPRLLRKWLCFWILHAPFMAMEYTLLGPQHFRGYHSIKLVVLAWLLMPQFEGAEWLLTRFIGPYLMRYEDKIDQKLQQAKEVSKKSMVQMAITGLTQVRRRSVKLLMEANVALRSRLMKDTVEEPQQDDQPGHQSQRQSVSNLLLQLATQQLAQTIDSASQGALDPQQRVRAASSRSGSQRDLQTVASAANAKNEILSDQGRQQDMFEEDTAEEIKPQHSPQEQQQQHPPAMQTPCSFRRSHQKTPTRYDDDDLCELTQSPLRFGQDDSFTVGLGSPVSPVVRGLHNRVIGEDEDDIQRHGQAVDLELDFELSAIEESVNLDDSQSSFRLVSAGGGPRHANFAAGLEREPVVETESGAHPHYVVDQFYPDPYNGRSSLISLQHKISSSPFVPEAAPAPAKQGEAQDIQETHSEAPLADENHVSGNFFDSHQQLAEGGKSWRLSKGAFEGSLASGDEDTGIRRPRQRKAESVVVVSPEEPQQSAEQFVTVRRRRSRHSTGGAPNMRNWR